MSLQNTLLNDANTFFSDMKLTFTANKRYDTINKEDTISLKSSPCKIYLSVKPRNYIYINNIEKCLQTSGTTMLNKIIDFGKYIGVKRITLSDYAMVDSNVCREVLALAAFEILTSGKSWYNKHGFVSSDANYEKAFNKQLSNSLFINVVSKKIKDNFIENFSEIDVSKLSIKEVLLYLKNNYLKRNYIKELTKSQCECIEELTLFLDDKIHYTRKLTLSIVNKTPRRVNVTKRIFNSRTKTKRITSKNTKRINTI